MPFTLCCVAAVLRHQPSADALQHLGPLMSEYLGPSAHLSLSEACSFDSLQLLDWIWEISPTTCTNKTQGWALTNYLRSNPHYYAYQFGRSLKAAVNSNNLVVAEWIFDHFSGCIVTADIVELAAEKGLLSVLQFFHDHDAGRSDLVDGLRRGNIIRWSGDSIMKAIEKEHVSVAWWLYEHSRQDVGEDGVTRFVQVALAIGDLELAERLVPEGRDVLEYSRYCFHPQVIEQMLERGTTGDDTLGHYGNSLRNLVQHGRLDLIQRVAELRAASRSSGENFLYYWYEAIMSASRHDLGIFRWLVDHPIGRELKTSAYRNFCHIMCELAQLGHVEAMQFLYDHGATDPCSCAMGNAVYAGHLDAVKWLIRSFPEAWKSSSHRFTRDAAQYGHLDILQLPRAGLGALWSRQERRSQKQHNRIVTTSGRSDRRWCQIWEAKRG